MNLENNKYFYIFTLGCAKNECDSEDMTKSLIESGYLQTDDPKKADLIIVNTCSFIQQATEESIDSILEHANINRGAKLVVSGCMPSRYKDSLLSEFPEVDKFVSCDDEKNISFIASSLIGNPDNNNTNPTNTDDEKIVSAYIKISEGCNRSCSFCTIPSIRGKYRSFPIEKIVSDVADKVEHGAREINLVAQDTGHYGKDFKDNTTLATLLEILSSKFADTYFRILYVQPDEVSDELLDVIAKHDNIIKYLDIPLQHVDKAILKSMNRSGNYQEFIEKIDKIKNKIEDVTLRTTLMVGFPGETLSQFDELLKFATLGLFDYIGVFAYSNEEGAKSYIFENQIDEEEKSYRLREIEDVIDAISVAKIQRKIGTIQKCIILGKEEDGQLFGRCLFQAPEVDGYTYIDKGNVGDIVDIKIIDFAMYDLEGELV